METFATTLNGLAVEARTADEAVEIAEQYQGWPFVTVAVATDEECPLCRCTGYTWRNVADELQCDNCHYSENIPF